MATPKAKLFVFSIFFAALFFVTVPQESPHEAEDPISSLRIELERLKTKVSILETTIEKSDKQLKSQDDGIKQMENVIFERSQSIETLQNEIETLQEVSNEQKIGIHMTDDEAPQVTEEETTKAEPASTFVKSLKEWISVMKDQWLPSISLLASHFEPLTVKIIEAYHLTENLLLSNTAKIMTTIAPFTQELPDMKDQWLTFIYSLCSSFESSTAKIIEAYQVTKNSLLPYTVKMQTTTIPFLQAMEAYKFAKPDTYQFETEMKPEADMDEATLQPDSGNSLWTCRMLVTSIISYHNQVQQWLKTTTLTRSLASIELAWFAATALLCLPVVCLCRFYSAIFRKRRKLGRSSHPDKVRRRLKRPLDFD